MALPRVPMVEFLVKKGYIKPEQLDEAKKVQEQTKEVDLGKVLVQLGMVGEREVLEGKAQELGYPFVDLDRVQIESSAINVVPERIAKNHSVIPVKKEGTNLWLAMSNINNIQAQDDVAEYFAAADAAGFGGCTNHAECEAACPKGIHIGFIARMNRDYWKATLFGAEESQGGDGAA